MRCAECGGIILADTEDWPKPLCNEHYEEFMIGGVDRAMVLREAAEDLIKAVEHLRDESLRGLPVEEATKVVQTELQEVAARLDKLAELEATSAKSPPKFARGDVVMLASAGTSDAALTVIEMHEATEIFAPMYECLVMARDGSSVLSVRLPEYAIAKRDSADIAIEKKCPRGTCELCAPEEAK